ncbi:hypothetical protein ACHHV8_14475 [Paenibacillus sp. TAB 01]|uniref:hypothetical protein n=1 Tax=Paenibacillus sp. TAB 01 TaxID=3368988 RepID=UPI003751F550
MEKEEAEDFPAVLAYEQEPSEAKRKPLLEFLNELEREHEGSGDLLRQIREITIDYKLPEDACTTFQLRMRSCRNWKQICSSISIWKITFFLNELSSALYVMQRGMMPMFRLPLLFIATGIVSFVGFHVLSLVTLGSWIAEPPRNPDGWFRIDLTVLDWGTMIAMGAVYQLMDVVLQRKLCSRVLDYVHYACFLAGSAILLYGFRQMEVGYIAAGAALTWIGICLLAWNIGQTMRLAAQWNAITISTACAAAYLVITGFLGIMA